MYFCWFVNSGTSQVKSETGPHTEGKERRKKEATPDWQAAILISKGIHM